jgi:predicted transcriptional regulator
MPRYGTHLQKDARDFFENYEEDFKKIEETKFEIIFDDENNRVIKDIGFVKKLEEMKKTLEEIMGECEEWEDDEEKYMIFDMDEYHVGDYILEQNRNWIYEYEIIDYYMLIKNKLQEYNVLVLEIE